MKRSRRLIIPAVLTVVTIGPGVVISCGDSSPVTPDAPVAQQDAPGHDAGVDSLPVVIDMGPDAEAANDAGVDAPIDAMPDAPA